MHDKTRLRILDFKLTVFTERPVHCDWQLVCNIWSSRFNCHMVIAMLQMWISVAVSKTSVNSVDKLGILPFYMIITVYDSELYKRTCTQFYTLLKAAVFVLPLGFFIIITCIKVWTFTFVLFSFWIE